MLGLLLLIVLIVGIALFIDADLLTYLCHLYRSTYIPRCAASKVMWIVGASSGLGEYLTYEAVANGAKCVIISSRRQDELERVAKEAKATYNPNANIVVVPVDVLSFLDEKNGREECEQLIMNVIKENKLSNIDDLVLNLGVTSRGLAVDTEPAVVRRVFDVNVRGVMVFAQSFVTCLRELRWTIPNGANSSRRGIYVTSSIAGVCGAPGRAVYAASKHAINGFFKSLRAEVVADNVHIGLVCPGPFRPTASSLDGLGAAADSSSGRLRPQDLQKKRMTAQRAAELYLTCISWRLSESWLTYSPYLLAAYADQFLPFFVPLLTPFFGPRVLQRTLGRQASARRPSKVL